MKSSAAGDQRTDRSEHTWTGVLLLCAILTSSVVPLRASFKYLDLEPGVSTRAEVERVLGKPLQTLGEMLFEHRAQEGTGPIYVEIRSAAEAIVERIEVGLIEPLDGKLVREALKLPDKATASQVDGQKQSLVEYYANAASIVLTFKGSQPSSGVISVGYLSDRPFAIELARASKAPPLKDPPLPPKEPPPPPIEPPLPPPPKEPPPRDPMPPVGPSVVPPSIRRDPLACFDLYQWSAREEDAARRARQVPRRQLAMDIRIASQAGDCERARSLTALYKKQFGSK